MGPLGVASKDIEKAAPSVPVTNEPTPDDDRPAAAAAAAAAAAEMTAAVTMTASAATTATSSPAGGGMAPADPERLGPVLEAAYGQCDKITSIFAKTFYQATKLMTEKQRKAVWAIYVWCRRTDDLVDGPRAMMNTDVMKADLAAWEERLYEVWEGKCRDSLDLCLYDTKLKYPEMEIEPYLDMIKGMAMDTPGELGKNR